MKIAHVIPYMHPSAGGPPVVVDKLSKELVLLGHEVRVITTNLFSGADREWQTAGMGSYELQVCETAAGGRYGFSPTLGKAVHKAVADYDLIHVHTLWTHASRVAMKACVKIGVPFLAMPHGMLDPYSMASGWLKKQVYGRLVEWPLLRRAAGVCYTHPEEERLASITCRGLPQGFIVELGTESPPDCSRCELRYEFLQRYPQLDNRRVILFLGRLHPKKGLDLLIPAFSQVLKERSDVHLILVGPGEPAYVSSLCRLIAEYQLERHVTLTGALFGRDKWAAMAGSDLFVLPSYQENFALTVVDAIRSGLPVIVSQRVNIWRDVVSAGAGRDCTPDLDSVTATIATSLDDREWLRAAQVAGAKMLETRFHWESSARRLELIYKTVLRRAVSA